MNKDFETYQHNFKPDNAICKVKLADWGVALLKGAQGTRHLTKVHREILKWK